MAEVGADFVLPPGGASAVESLTYRCEAIKIDGLNSIRRGRTPAAGSSMKRRIPTGFSMCCVGTE